MRKPSVSSPCELEAVVAFPRRTSCPLPASRFSKNCWAMASPLPIIVAATSDRVRSIRHREAGSATNHGGTRARARVREGEAEGRTDKAASPAGACTKSKASCRKMERAVCHQRFPPAGGTSMNVRTKGRNERVFCGRGGAVSPAAAGLVGRPTGGVMAGPPPAKCNCISSSDDDGR
jgi:hypothetical protein